MSFSSSPTKSRIPGIDSAYIYHELMNEHNRKMLEVIQAFDPYDLNSKSDHVSGLEQLKTTLVLAFTVLATK